MKKVLVILAITAMCGSTAWAVTVCSTRTGSDGGYFYTLWTNGQGTVCMNLNGGGNYTLQWTNAGNFIAGKGWNPGDSRTVTWTGGCTGQFFGVYGWATSPLVEYYIGRTGGTSAGSYSANGKTYTLFTQSCNGPNITGNGLYTRYCAAGYGGSGQNMGQHFSGWSSLGKGVNNQNYMVVACAAWGSTGSANVTVGGSTSTTTTTTTTTSGSSTSTSYPPIQIVVRARGTSGSESINLTVGGSTISTWTLTTSMVNYNARASDSSTGAVNVQFTNDASGRDVQVDYVVVNGSTRQSESQSTNTGVLQNGKCGGSYSEWLNCNGYIDYGNI